MDSKTRRSNWIWRDGLGYALAFLAWVALSAASALALLAVRSTIGPLTLAIGVRDLGSQQPIWELGARAGTFDSIARVAVGVVWLVYILIVEEYLRSSIGDARAQRIRAASAGADDNQTVYSRRGLRTLARRTLIAAAFPAAVFILYLVLQGVLSLLVRA
ncbi:MAG: hypothetical protein MUC51_06580 [Anaerolineae bacterium]|jgi:hypothetical protein|nr:hypothetical protein [Anaerolineae bacterium]